MFCTVYGRQRVYRRRGDITAVCCVQEVGPFGGGSLNSVDRDLWAREDKTGHR